MTRITLPHRRPSRTYAAAWEGHPITVTVGFHPATGQPMEVFADAEKGGQMQATIADACVWASLALQHGIPPEALAKSLSRVPDLFTGQGADLPGSPLGVIAGILMEVA